MMTQTFSVCMAHLSLPVTLLLTLHALWLVTATYSITTISKHLNTTSLDASNNTTFFHFYTMHIYKWIFSKILRIDNTMHRPGLGPPGNGSLRCLWGQHWAIWGQRRAQPDTWIWSDTPFWIDSLWNQGVPGPQQVVGPHLSGFISDWPLDSTLALSLMPQPPPGCWDYKCAPTCLAFFTGCPPPLCPDFRHF